MTNKWIINTFVLLGFSAFLSLAVGSVCISPNLIAKTIIEKLLFSAKLASKGIAYRIVGGSEWIESKVYIAPGKSRFSHHFYIEHLTKLSSYWSYVGYTLGNGRWASYDCKAEYILIISFADTRGFETLFSQSKSEIYFCYVLLKAKSIDSAFPA